MTDIVVGDTDVPRLTVSPFDGGTAAALTVTRPDGTTLAVPVAVELAGTDGQLWQAEPVTYDAPGGWVLTWTVTGTGQGVEAQQVYVLASPTAGGAVWLPGRSRVANYIPGRTLNVDPAVHSAAGETYDPGWGPNTRPTGQQVDRLILDQASLVSVRVPRLTETHHEAASTVVAMLVAAAIERGQPDTDPTSLQRALDLERQALARLDELVRGVDEETGETAAGPVMPVWSMPAPVPWGDSYF
ncbi:hypothetical protein [Catenuloplanes indicus]|uniref:Uncharacterized protein n=1 Tax=Catenuloplanes indicus TaxID=137267 RepID=A0AAE3W8T8_9ACTN|nr:hypothetical protein [Catenuloplanes indicus]MDQ0371621.1 hypothetical protein [Catenuloplanes indicus]